MACAETQAKTENKTTRAAARAGLRKSQLDLNRRSDELVADAVEALERAHAAGAEVRFARGRVVAALESPPQARTVPSSLSTTLCL